MIHLAGDQDILLEVAQKLYLENAFNRRSLVLLPNRRSCRTLMQKIIEVHPAPMIMPNVLTFADIRINKHLFLPSCPSLDISSNCEISSLELKVVVASVLREMLIDLSHIDSYLAFLIKFHTFCGDKQKLENHPEALKFINLIDARLKRIGKGLSQKMRNEAVRQIIEAWEDDTALKIFAVIPTVTPPPYLATWLKFLQQRPNAHLFKVELALSSESNIVRKQYQLIECANEIEESNVVGAIVREALHENLGTIAVICNNRQMVRRVKQSFKRWNIVADDTTESFLLDAQVSSLFLLVLQLLQPRGFSCSTLLAVLKHPLCLYYNDPELDTLNINLLRVASHYKSFQEFYEAHNTASQLIKDLGSIIIGFQYDEYIMAHWSVFDRLYGGDREAEDYVALKRFVEELTQALKYDDFNRVIENYSTMVANLLTGYSYRSESEHSDDVVIMTIQEVRLHRFVNVILMGTNEGQFPAIKKEGTILGFTTERELGFSSLEDKIEEASTDFAELLLQPRVIITRSLLVGNTEQLPSRFIDNITHKHEYKYVKWVRELNKAERSRSVSPRPVVATQLRPSQISVSGIEKLMRDPYAYYAEYILKLKPLDEIGQEISRREFGIITHLVLKDVDSASYPKEGYTTACCEQFLRKVGYRRPKQIEFWLAHFIRIVAWIWEYNHSRSVDYKQYQEVQGKIDVNGIRITAIADRIDIKQQGVVASASARPYASIIDYKTGSIPTGDLLRQGLFPQLPIEGLILMDNGFDNIQSGNTSVADGAQLLNREEYISLIYLVITGKHEPGKEVVVDWDADITRQNLTQLVDRFFKDEQQSFFAASENDETGKTSRFKQLSRLDEWRNS